MGADDKQLGGKNEGLCVEQLKNVSSFGHFEFKRFILSVKVSPNVLVGRTDAALISNEI